MQLETEKFKMTSIRSTLDMITPNMFLGSIDLVQAYYSIPIHEEYKKYLKFWWEGELFQFTCLPNGMCQAPFFFTKILKPVYSNLHSKGHLSTYYLDDSLIMGDTVEECTKNMQDTLDLLNKLGFFVHKEKSSFIPSQCIEYLGFEINSLHMYVCLTKNRQEKLIKTCKLVKSMVTVSLQLLASMIGLMVASFVAIPIGKIYYRQLEREKIEGLKAKKGDWEQKIKLSSEAIKEIDWWIDHADYKCKIDKGKPKAIITTDASMTGFGAIYGKNKINGLWMLNEKINHINYLELLAVFYALKAFGNEFHNIHVRFRVDNMTTLHLINNLGTCRSDQLNKLTKKLWQYALKKGLWLSAEYVPTDKNEADILSRKINIDAEWKLNVSFFEYVIGKLNFTPNIDLFATRLNCQLPVFASYAPDPFATYVDAFNLDWSEFKFFAFPPFCLLLKVLRKIREDKATGILILPIWTAQPFYSVAMKLLQGTPIILSPRRNLLIMPDHPEMEHRLCRKMSLLCGIFSGKN